MMGHPPESELLRVLSLEVVERLAPVSAPLEWAHLPEGPWDWVVLHIRDYVDLHKDAMNWSGALEIETDRVWLRRGLQSCFRGRTWMLTSRKVPPGSVRLVSGSQAWELPVIRREGWR